MEQSVQRAIHLRYSWHISTIFPLTEALSNSSCARAASQSGSRSATTGLIVFCSSMANNRDKSSRNHSGCFFFSVVMLCHRGFSWQHPRKPQPNEARPRQHHVPSTAFNGRGHSLPMKRPPFPSRDTIAANCRRRVDQTRHSLQRPAAQNPRFDNRWECRRVPPLVSV